MNEPLIENRVFIIPQRQEESKEEYYAAFVVSPFIKKQGEKLISVSFAESLTKGWQKFKPAKTAAKKR